MKASKLFGIFVILALLIAALPAISVGADGPDWASGKDDTATIKAVLKYRHLFNPKKSGYEGFLGPCLGGYECNVGQANWDTNPAKYAATNKVKLQYDGVGQFTATIDPDGPDGPYVMQTTATFPAPGTLNYLQLDLRGQVANGVDEIVSFKNGQLNGNALTDANGTNTWSYFMIKGVDLTNGFTLEGDMVLTWPQSGTGCDDCTVLHIKVGYLAPSDTEGPLTSNVTVTKNKVLLPKGSTLTALVDDSATGSSNIASAEYSFDNATWTPMAATDGAFDEVSEDVTASVLAPAAGTYDLCVRGTDDKGNVGAPACTAYYVYETTLAYQVCGDWEEGALDFQNALPNPARNACVDINNNDNAIGRFAFRHPDGHILGRSNGAGDNGVISYGFAFKFTGGQPWERTVPFAYGTKSGNNTIWTPQFNKGSVKLVFMGIFRTDNVKNDEDKTVGVIEIGDFRAIDGDYGASFNCDRPGKVCFQEYSGGSWKQIGRTNGAADDGDLESFTVLKVRTAYTLDGSGKIVNVYKLVPIAMIERGSVFRLNTPRYGNNIGTQTMTTLP